MTPMTQKPTFRVERTLGSFGPGGLVMPYLSVDVAIASGGRLVTIDRGHSVLTGGLRGNTTSDDAAARTKRVKVWSMADEGVAEFGISGTFGESGVEDGQTIWPTAVAVDKDDRVYVADEGRQDIQMFDLMGTFLGKWGSAGNGPAQFDRPSGLAFLPDGTLLVADAGNDRIQKFSPSGEPRGSIGETGSAPGQLKRPWGLTVDAAGDIYVADWGNDRIQKLDKDGRFLASFGSSGSADGQLKRPSGVAVDADGNVYVADLGNNRVQVFSGHGEHLATLHGDGRMSKSAIRYYQANPPDCWVAQGVQRRERPFEAPTAVRIDPQGRLLVVDTLRCRIQVYEKVPAAGSASLSWALDALAEKWDAVDEHERARLGKYRPLVERLPSTPQERERHAWLATDWLVREYAPIWLDRAGLADQARSLRELPELRSAEQVAQAMPLVAAAEDHAADAAVRSGADAPRGAAWDAARATAWPFSILAASEPLATETRDAVGAAAWAAVSSPATTLPEAIEPVFALFDRLVAVGRDA